MSHYSVLVGLPPNVSNVQAALEKALAPYDENLQVEPYRDYEDGSAEDYYMVTAIRRGAEHHRNGTGIKPPRPPGEFGYSSEWSTRTPEQQRADHAADAAMLARLGSPVTWEKLVEVHNERYPEADGSTPLHYEPDTGRAYSMSTRNPQAKWDYWRIGGRWRGHFPLRAAGTLAEIRRRARSDVICTEKDWDSPDKPADGRCDGGRKRALDLDGLVLEKARQAEGDWDDYSLVVFGTEPALPWRVFAEKVDQSGNGGYSWDDARRDYRTQQRVQALSASEKFGHCDNAHDTFETFTRDEYAARQAARAIPGFATLDAALDGGWFAPGRMGWFGCSDDDEHSYAAYVQRANDYVNRLPDDAWLVVVDCHI